MNTTTKTPAANTKFINSFHGWEGRTRIDVNGQTWEISTMKRYSGKLTTNAMKIKVLESSHGCEVTTFGSSEMFNTLNLISEKVRVTQNAVKDQHERALLIFDAKIDAGEIESERPETPEIGTIIFLDGYDSYQGSKGNNWVVYQVDGENYKCVEKDTLLLQDKDYVKPLSKKFGIGNYFEPDFKFEGSEDDLANLVIEAQKKAEQDSKQEKADQEEARAVRASKIEEGKKLVSVPQWAKTVIVADFYQDDSDSQTDYFSTSIGRTIYLTFSKSDRNNMTELHKAKLLFEDTKDLEDEHNDQYSYLPDYFIGSSSWSGWKVNKRKYFDLTKTESLELLYIAAAEGRYLIGEATPEAEPVRIEGLNIFIVDYSEKAVAVFGDTKEIKEQLKSLGGRFNKFLTHNGEKKPGWIFKKEQLEELEKLV